MSRGFTTNDPERVSQLLAAAGAKGVVSTIPADLDRSALLTQIRMRDEAIDELRSALEAKRSECERWVAYNNRINARLEKIREALK